MIWQEILLFIYSTIMILTNLGCYVILSIDLIKEKRKWISL